MAQPQAAVRARLVLRERRGAAERSGRGEGRGPHAMRPVRDAADIAADRFWLLGLAFAILVAPFIGGIRGPAVYAGWLLLPIAAAWREPRRAGWLGVLPSSPRDGIMGAGAGLLIGLATAGLLLAAHRAQPALLAFVLQLPILHQDMTGGSLALFLALIPAAHVAHELFYRAFLQRVLAARLDAQAPAILLAGLMFAWTHVVAFQSDASHAAIATLTTTHAWPDVSALQAFLGLLSFVAIESLVAGALFARTGTIVAGVAFRATNLLVIGVALLR